MSIFTLDESHFKLMGSEEATRLFRDLLWAEASRLNIPSTQVTVSMNINMPDGGVDASVEADNIDVIGLIENGHNAYQIKSGSGFAPWQRSAIKKELFGNNSPSLDNLKPLIGDCFKQSGKYTLVCFGQDLTPEQKQSALDHHIEMLSECGFEEPRIDVLGISHLIGLFQQYPSLALRINRRGNFRFETHQIWSQRSEMHKRYFPSNQLVEKISDIQTELLENTTAMHIRILGEPGIGKTRLALELTDKEELRPLVIYSHAAHFLGSDLLFEIAQGDFSAILVIDECNPTDRANIWDRLEYHGERIKLITIYNDFRDLNAAGTRYIEMPALEEEQIREILSEYIPQDRAFGWASACSGSPRVAHMVGQNLRENPEDLLRSPSTVDMWERYIVGGDQANTIQVQQRRTVLYHLALFKRFGFAHPVDSEAKEIHKIIEQVDASITWPKFHEIVRKLQKRRIIQGEKTLYITPKLLHIWLWTQWWDIYGGSFEAQALAQFSPQLLEWYLEMFQYAAGSDAALKTVRSLLGPDGPFQQNPDFLTTELGSRFFFYLATADPPTALTCLKATLGTFSHEKLLAFRFHRMNILNALDEIVIWQELFEDAARLMLALAVAENETWSNNATGRFTDLFAIQLHKELSPTEAPFEERLALLTRMLESEDEKVQQFGLESIKRALNTSTGGGYFPQINIVGKQPDPWVPKTWGDVWQAYLSAWRLLYSRLDQLPEDKRDQGVSILLESVDGLSRHEGVQREVFDDIRKLSDRSYVDPRDVIKTAVRILQYRDNNLSDELVVDWKRLRDDLTGTDFHSMLRRYVGMDLWEDRVDENLETTDKVGPHLEQLATQSLEDPSKLKAELEWLVTYEARNGFRFGYELAKLDTQLELLPRLLKAQAHDQNKTSAYFLGGYLRFVSEIDAKRWEEIILEISQESDLREWVPELVWRSKEVTVATAHLVLEVIASGDSRATNLSLFTYGGVVRQVPKAIFNEWIRYLISKPGITEGLIALDLFSSYYLAKDTQETLPEHLTLDLLVNPSLVNQEPQQNNKRADFDWRRIAVAFIQKFPDNTESIAEFHLRHLDTARHLFDLHIPRGTEVLNQAVQNNPKIVWKLIETHLNDPQNSNSLYEIRRWLRGDDENWADKQQGALKLFPPELIWHWVDENVEERAWRLAYFAPKELFRPKSASEMCWAREILVRYGKREDVQRNLSANFATESWSGPSSVHYQKKRDFFLEFKKEESDENVRNWLEQEIITLEQRIENARMNEERRY